MKRIYLDYAASTPVDPRVLRGMMPYFGKHFGNPGSLHSFGQEAIAAVDKSRETVARAIGAEFRGIIFTGSATEANNIAIRGSVETFKKNNPGVIPKIIISSIEHESVMETAKRLARSGGAEVATIPVSDEGIVGLEALDRALDERTVLVSIMHANNEVGTVQPIAEIGTMIHNFRAKKYDEKTRGKISSHGAYPLFHADAAQAFQFFDCNVQELGVDMMTLSSQKIYGPKGAGALYLRQRGQEVPWAPKTLTTGGGQEFGFRSGTENVPAIVGFAKAVEFLSPRATHNKKISALREALWKGIKKSFKYAEINGPATANKKLPSILNVYFPGREAQDLLTKWDLAGLAVSSGSACRSRAMEASHVIEALGYPKDRARASVRLSLGRPTNKNDISEALRIIKKAL